MGSSHSWNSHVEYREYDLLSKVLYPTVLSSTVSFRCERAISEEDANEIVGEEFSEEEIGRKHCNYQEEKIACLSPDMNTQEMLSCLTKSLNFTSSLFRRALATEVGNSLLHLSIDL